MYEDIIQAIEQSDYSTALNYAKTYPQDNIDDTYAILMANICYHYNEYDIAFNYIRTGLLYNYKNYELYLLLGMYYARTNLIQARLCYENALYYCSSEQDRYVIDSFLADPAFANVNVPPVSIIILSYNQPELTRKCLENIQLYNSESSYELILIDNASDQKTLDYLHEIEKNISHNLKILYNTENKGFPYACNQGIQLSNSDNDIFLLNNDAFLMPNSLFWLRMGLYSNQTVGATGAVTNYAANDQVAVPLDWTYEQCFDYAKNINLPELHPYETKMFLIGYAMLIKRIAINQIGLLDTSFSPGQFEDTDYGIRLNLAGYQTLLCHNSFIFHLGGGGKKDSFWQNIIQTNSEKFDKKWGFHIAYYNIPRYEIINMITEDKNAPLKILEVGCALGATLNKIKYLWPNSEVNGIEYVDNIVNIANKHTCIKQGDIETLSLSYQTGYFDYIICADVLDHLQKPELVLQKLIPYLKPNGRFLCSLPNIRHFSVLMPLLKIGQFNYKDQGILDKAHLRFYTRKSIYTLASDCGLSVKKMIGKHLPVTEEDQFFLNTAINSFEISDPEELSIYQYLFILEK